MAVSLFFGLLPSAQPAPGLGGASGRAARLLGAGGVIIDYRTARTKADEVDVERVEAGLVVHVDDLEHRLTLAPWELAEVLRVAHVVGDDGYLEVSIDPLSDGSKGLGTTPELVVKREITPLGMAMLQTDVDFARFCRGAADPANTDLYRIAPSIRAMDLLEHDRRYRALTLDLVVPPIARSQVRARIDTLSRAEPVVWTTGVDVHYFSPQGQVVDADGDLIDAEVVALAKQPYREFADRLDAAGASGRAARNQVPALERVETYAIALTALDAHCRREPNACDAWRADALAAAKESSARVPTIDDEEIEDYIAGIAVPSVRTKWTNVRYDVVRSAPTHQRALALLDELVFDVKTGRGDQELLDTLLDQRLVGGDPTTRLLLDFHRGLRPSKDTEPLPPEELLRMMQRVDDVVEDPERAMVTRELLASSVLATPGLRGSGAWSSAKHTIARCIHELDVSAELARTDPHRRSAEGWLEELGRLERCRIHAAMAGWPLLRIGASFHYAAGARWATRVHGRDEALFRAASDRLRVLRAHERALLTHGDERGWVQVGTMIGSLEEALRR